MQMMKTGILLDMPSFGTCTVHAPASDALTVAGNWMIVQYLSVVVVSQFLTVMFAVPAHLTDIFKAAAC